jgi:quercetin dioxygenase-like cupin family protein
MATLITEPALVDVPGGKLIQEFAGRVASGDATVSVALMTAPAGWSEPAQTPQFDEVTVVLDGEVVVQTDQGPVVVVAGQGFVARAGERIRYACPKGARYIAVCAPAFSPDTVNREDG